MSRLRRSWTLYVALLLLLPVWWWVGLPPLWSPVDLAEHYVTTPEEEHCNEVCPHPTSLVDPPQASSLQAVASDCSHPPACLVTRLPHLRKLRPPPPKLITATLHSLRAPPALMLA
ncbi:MAG: hypothetical protein JNL86_17900 [Nitrospira sp.]|nr:hypothetical protein [Nitrospira sp.]MCC7472092.1 hypothetical protein [Candidatus Nomurabacteria bacterium]